MNFDPKRSPLPAVFYGIVTAVSATGKLDVYTAGAVDLQGNKISYAELGTMLPGVPLTGANVVGSWADGPAQRNLPFLFGEPAPNAANTQSALSSVMWPMARQNQQRTGAASRGAKVATFTSGLLTDQYGKTNINQHAALYARTSDAYVFQVGASTTYMTALDGGIGSPLWDFASTSWTHQIALASISPLQLVWDAALGRLWVLTGSLLTSYDPEVFHLHPTDWTAVHLSAVAVPAGVVLEPLPTSAGIIIVDSSDWTSWAWKMLKADDLTTTLSTFTMPWKNWSLAGGLPHSSPGTSYPLFPTIAPIFGPQASTHPNVQPIVTAAGCVVAPGDDPAFLARLATEQAAPRTYETQTPRNYGWLAERSAMMCFDPTGLTVAWSVIGWDVSAQYKGFTPLFDLTVAGTEQILAHWERYDFSAKTFCFPEADLTLIDLFPAYAHPLCVNSDGTVNLTNTGDANFNKTFSWISYDAGYDGSNYTGDPWNPSSDAPAWAYDPTVELDGKVAALLAMLTPPGFSAAVTRDYPSNMTHGLVAISAVDGSTVGNMEFTDNVQTYVNTFDTGDPDCTVHSTADTAIPPRQIFKNTYRTSTVTLAAAVDDAPHITAGLASNETVLAYVAVETFTLSNAWTGADGGSHSTFYQGHAWYGAYVDDNGVTQFTPPGDIDVVSGSPSDTWGVHTTTSVTYNLVILARDSYTTTAADPRYGFDPINALTDGTRAFLLPRCTAPIIPPTVQHAYFPPGTTYIGQLPVPISSYSYDNFWISNYPIPGAGPATQVTGLDPGGQGWTSSSPNGGPTLSGGYSLVFNPAVDMGGDGPAWDCGTFGAVTGIQAGIANFAFIWRGYGVPPIPPYSVDANGYQLASYDGTLYYLSFPPYGYWYDGGDRTDPKNWTPVDFGSPQTRFRGRKGDPPKGGYYVTDPTFIGPDPTHPLWTNPFATAATQTTPTIPYRSDSTFHGVLYCLDLTTKTKLWARDFGALTLQLPTCAAPCSGKLYFWRPGMAHLIDPATGADIQTVALPDSTNWKHADMVVEDGKVVVVGDSGRYDIT